MQYNTVTIANSSNSYLNELGVRLQIVDSARTCILSTFRRKNEPSSARLTALEWSIRVLDLWNRSALKNCTDMGGAGNFRVFFESEIRNHRKCVALFSRKNRHFPKKSIVLQKLKLLGQIISEVETEFQNENAEIQFLTGNAS